MAATFIPPAIAHLRVFDLRKLEKFPITAGRQTLTALTAELEDKSPFASIRVPQDDRAEFAVIALMVAGDLLLAQDRLTEQPIGRARHAGSSARYYGSMMCASDSDRHAWSQCAPLSDNGLPLVMVRHCGR